MDQQLVDASIDGTSVNLDSLSELEPLRSLLLQTAEESHPRAARRMPTSDDPKRLQYTELPGASKDDVKSLTTAFVCIESAIRSISSSLLEAGLSLNVSPTSSPTPYTFDLHLAGWRCALPFLFDFVFIPVMYVTQHLHRFPCHRSVTFKLAPCR